MICKQFKNNYMYPQSIQIIEDKLKGLNNVNAIIQHHVRETQSAYNEAIIDLDKNETTIRGLEKELAMMGYPTDTKSTSHVINEIVSPDAMADVERLQYILRECDALQDKIKAAFQKAY